MQKREFVHNSKITYALNNVFSSTLAKVFSFSILTAVAAQIAVPVQPVPFTLQTMMVLLSGAFLGSRNGAYSQFLYLAMGAAGLPVFANGTFSAAVLFGPTGGYLLAFPIAAFIAGYGVEKFKNYFSIAASMFFAEAVVIITGMLYLNSIYLTNLNNALSVGGAIFSVWAVVKVFASVSIYFAVKKGSNKY